MFADTPTPFDFRFRLFGFPCSISGMFWLGALLLGNYEFQSNSIVGMVAWIVAMLLSIMVHELGHAVVARSFGCRVHDVRLTMMGGFCAYDREPPMRWQRIAISLAGPAAGFLLWGLLKGADLQFELNNRAKEVGPILEYYVLDLLFINKVWGILNLLPILPMDGGRVCSELCEGAKVKNPYVTARWIGVVTASAIVLLGLLMIQGSAPQAIAKLLPEWFQPSTLTIIWFGLFAVQNYMEIQQTKTSHGWRGSYQDDDDREPWKSR